MKEGAESHMGWGGVQCVHNTLMNFVDVSVTNKAGAVLIILISVNYA